MNKATKRLKARLRAVGWVGDALRQELFDLHCALDQQRRQLADDARKQAVLEQQLVKARGRVVALSFELKRRCDQIKALEIALT